MDCTEMQKMESGNSSIFSNFRKVFQKYSHIRRGGLTQHLRVRPLWFSTLYYLYTSGTPAKNIAHIVDSIKCDEEERNGSKSLLISLVCAFGSNHVHQSKKRF